MQSCAAQTRIVLLLENIIKLCFFNAACVMATQFLGDFAAVTHVHRAGFDFLFVFISYRIINFCVTGSRPC